jgi:hypothetical protein
MSLQGLFAFLSLFAALCTIFVLVATAAEAWREHAQLSWPSATASIQHCRVDTYRRSRSGALGERSRIACYIQYSVNDNDVQAYIHSSSSSSDATAALMRQWVAAHRPGTSLEIRYDPSDSKAAVLTQTGMPLTGPHTPNNLKLLAIAAIAFVVFYSLARTLQGRQTPVPTTST